MIYIMQPDATPRQITKVLTRIEQSGGQTQVSALGEQTIIGVLGSLPPDEQEQIEAMEGVAGKQAIRQPYKLASRQFHPQPTLVQVNGVTIGGPQVGVMAGPCAVESRQQILETARAVRAAGATVLRGGAYKPRSSPYSFQGLGEEGLKLLAEARAETGLPVVTEVMDPDTTPLVAAYADILQIGARNMQNFSLLNAVGEAQRPVLLKRSLMSTIEELLMAAEYILAHGNQQVILCERGIRTFETATRNTFDVSAVPLLKQLTHLPVIADPSHATGQAGLVAPVALAAIAAGADGLEVEVHPRPEEALSDGKQSLTPQQFSEMMGRASLIAAAVGRHV